MFKRFSLIALSLFSSPLFAFHPGFYTGLGFGADTTHFDETAYIRRPLTFDVQNDTERGAQGVLANIFGGFAWTTCSNLYIAGELNGNYSSAESRTRNLNFTSRAFSKTIYRIDDSWGASILPGILLPEATLFYARVGYSGGHLRIITSDISLRNVSTWLDGIRFGAGIEKEIGWNLSVRAEYDHIYYSRNSSFTFDPLGDVTKRTNISPSSNQFEFDLIYRFA